MKKIIAAFLLFFPLSLSAVILDDSYIETVYGDRASMPYYRIVGGTEVKLGYPIRIWRGVNGDGQRFIVDNLHDAGVFIIREYTKGSAMPDFYIDIDPYNIRRVHIDDWPTDYKIQ